MKNIDYSPIRIFNCAAKRCISKTSLITDNWFKDGWGIVGLNDEMLPELGGIKTVPREPFEETEFARRLLEADHKLTTQSTVYAAVLLCPEHKNLVDQAQSLRQAHAEKHPTQVDDCNLCKREIRLRRSEG